MLFLRRLTLALLCAPAFGLAVSHAAAAQSAASPISVMQEFTRPDKRRAKAARFEAEAAAAEAQRGVGLANVQRNAVSAWLDRWYAEQAGAVLGQHDHLTELARQAATAAYRSGRGTRADVLTAELEIQRLHDKQDENRVAVATTTLNLERRPANQGCRRAV